MKLTSLYGWGILIVALLAITSCQAQQEDDDPAAGFDLGPAEPNEPDTNSDDPKEDNPVEEEPEELDVQKPTEHSPVEEQPTSAGVGGANEKGGAEQGGGDQEAAVTETAVEEPEEAEKPVEQPQEKEEVKDDDRTGPEVPDDEVSETTEGAAHHPPQHHPKEQEKHLGISPENIQAYNNNHTGTNETSKSRSKPVLTLAEEASMATSILFQTGKLPHHWIWFALVIAYRIIVR